MKITNLKIVSGSIGAGKVTRVKVTVRKKGVIVRKYVKRRAHTYCDFAVGFDILENEVFILGHDFVFTNNPSIAFVPTSSVVGKTGIRHITARICATQHKYAISFPFTEEIISLGQALKKSEFGTKSNPSHHLEMLPLAKGYQESWYDEQIQKDKDAFADPVLKELMFLKNSDNPESSDFPESNSIEGGTPFFNREVLQNRIDELEQWHGNENYSRKFEGTDIMRTVMIMGSGEAYMCKVWLKNELAIKEKCLRAKLELAQAFCETLNPYTYL